MPIEIVSPRQRIEETEYVLYFRYAGADSDGGYAFPCDPSGTVDVDALEDLGRENYLNCVNGLEPVDEPEVREYQHTHTEPAIGKCPCGELVVLEGFTNTCTCGRDYNWAGQELAPRSQWGEDTGESLADILRIP